MFLHFEPLGLRIYLSRSIHPESVKTACWALNKGYGSDYFLGRHGEFSESCCHCNVTHKI